MLLFLHRDVWLFKYHLHYSESRGQFVLADHQGGEGPEGGGENRVGEPHSDDGGEGGEGGQGQREVSRA